jgi:alkylation response protein AidB-like acyl-CoA dehydrogenase
MQLRDTPDEAAFRAEVRAWLDEHNPGLDGVPETKDKKAWSRKIYDAGYAGLTWPEEYGGQGASYSHQAIVYEEWARAEAPGHLGTIGLGMAGPTIIAHGTDEQKQRYLANILSAEEIWCQGFSEPGAGSDLAALKTRAVRDGDDYVVNGHKIWCSFAHVADVGELLVRTHPDAPKHRGISWLILPMDAPGIEIRPLPTLAGEGEFSEVFLNDVRVPVSQRVGAENDGWRITNVTLRFERGTAFASEMIQLQQFLGVLAGLAQRVTRGGERAWDDAGVRHEIGHLAAELDALWAMVKLSVSKSTKTGVPGLEGSALKLYYTELYQRIVDLGMRLLGRAALSRDDVDGLPSRLLLHKALQSLSLTIAAGSSQIQRNIVAERILGLPKER